MANKETKMTFVDAKPQDRDNKITTNYNHDVTTAEFARNNQYRDTDPMLEKEGFLGMDDIDRMRRRKIGKIF